MKKVISIIIAIVFVVSMTAVAVSAQSYNPNGVCDIKFNAKHADPANVIKDGIIGENEYEKLDVNLDPDSASLTLVFGNNAAMYTNAEDMMGTMEYYFSWDEIHGFNFAVKCKPPVFEQNIPQGTGDKPGDDFLCNLGLQVEFGPTAVRDELPLFYYAVSKNAKTGEYYEGHYQQLGNKGAYDPVPGVDYEVAFGADGTVTYEWSIALDNFTNAPTAAGTNIYFTLDALAGTDSPDGDLYTDCYGVSFGDFGFMVAAMGDHESVVATLSDEQIGGGSPDTAPNTNTDTNPDTTGGDGTTGTGPVDSSNPGTEPKTDDPSNPSQGNNNPAEGNNPSEGNKAPSTADPIVIAAIASALSACGFMLSKKRK